VARGLVRSLFVPEAVSADADELPLVIGRYALFDALASGGMATVHLGRLLGPADSGRTVAVKRLHPHFTTDEEFVAMFMDEARIVAHIRHPNVVPMVDVIQSRRGVYLIMEYIHGESFSKLLRVCRAASEQVPIPLITAIVHGALLGLHAAHETKDEHGVDLQVVHRDVSPQNIIVGVDGLARVLDFGVAKAAGRAQITREGQIKGKLAYMAPEQIRGIVDRRSDVFAASVVLWEALAGRRMHDGASDVDIVTRVVKGAFGPPSEVRSDIPPELDAVVMKGLEINPAHRYATANEMAHDLEHLVGLGAPADVAAWVESLAGDSLDERAAKVAAMEISAVTLTPRDPSEPPPNAAGSVSRLSAPQHVAPPAPLVKGPDHEDRTERMDAPLSGHLVPDLRASVETTITGTGPHLPAGFDRRIPASPPVQTMRPFAVIAITAFVLALMLIAGVIGIVKYASRRATTSAPSSRPAVSASARSEVPKDR
jgi:serine/threonine-protein kinase